MKRVRFALLLVVGLCLTVSSLSAQLASMVPGLPRNETLVVAIQGGRNPNANYFNLWVPPQFLTHGLQQASVDTLWYIDQLNGEWFDALAAGKPVYNRDFTDMTVKLRKGIYWSDGVEFTADDVIATVEVQQKNKGMVYTDFFNIYVDSVTKTDNYTVVFKLKKPNSRFHVQFVVRWSACYILPAHIYRNLQDPVKFNFNPPVSLGPYVLKDYDPNGYWFIWQRREDWQRTSVGMVYGQPAPKYLVYIHYGDLVKQTIAFVRHELDVSQLWSPDAWEALRKQSKGTIAWYDDFPWACFGDPATPGATLNNDVYPLGMRDVRWALALTVDIVTTLTASYGGAARVTPLHNTPTTPYYKWYYEPLEPWLKEFSFDVGGQQYKPYDPTVPFRMVAEAKKRGNNVPTSDSEIRETFGIGWWKFAPDIAEQLLLRSGFRRDGSKRWIMPNGQPFKLSVLSATPEVWPLQARLGAALASKWREFGIDAKHDVNDLQGSISAQGRYDVVINWPIETWGGLPDLHRFLQYWHSDYYKPIGETTTGRNQHRWKSKELDAIVDEMNKYSVDSDKTIELGREAMKLLVREMPIIPMVGQNQLDPADTYYWENWPTAKNPYAYPLPSGGNYRVVFPRLKATGRK